MTTWRFYARQPAGSWAPLDLTHTGDLASVLARCDELAAEMGADVNAEAIDMRPIHTLVWHCTATPEGREFTRAQIKAMHVARGFNDIGYHKLVHLDGSVSEGRDEAKVGAHVAGHNTGTLGYSYVGGVDAKNKPKDTRTPAQKATMFRLTREAVERYRLRAIVGHRDLSPDRDGDGMVEPNEWVKQCPCFDAAPEYAAVLRPTTMPTAAADPASCPTCGKALAA